MPPLSREEIAKIEIGHTDIAAWLARAMTTVFLAALFAVPVVHECTSPDNENAPPATTTWPRCCSIFTALPEVAVAFDRADGDLWQRTLAANARLLKTVDLYESSLKDESLLVERLLGPTQYCLSRWGRLGNEKAYLGRDGWLFYRPSVDYTTGPGFLDPRILSKRSQAGKPYAAPVQPDPRVAIIDFARQLRGRGIALLLVPAPGKAMIHPEQLTSRLSGTAEALHNESFDEWKQEMEREGVLVFDPAPLLSARKRETREHQFLKTDTHWTAGAVEAVADELRRFIDARTPLPAWPTSADHHARRRNVAGTGDIAAMLRLPEGAALFPQETVEIRQIVDGGGAAWQPDGASDVLLLGDSFTNIYSQPSLHWGTSAGLAEQLSVALARPLDRIAQNDSGAYATRQTLAQELARGDDRLAGKRLVIWEFAARELAVGDWKLIPLADPAPESESPSLVDPFHESPPSRPAGQLVVRGTVEAAAGVPRPGSVPYRDAVMAVHLTVVEAVAGESPAEIVVYLLGMQDNRWTPAARYKPGDRVTLRLQPWEHARSKYGSLTRIELDDPDFKLIDLPLFWGEENQ